MPVSTSISTRQASDLLGVHESSVKRWCNAGDLGCEYTHGGHRRIPLAELLRFAEARSIEVALLDFGPDAPQVWVEVQDALKGNFKPLTKRLLGWMLEGEHLRGEQLIRQLLEQGISVASVCDDLLAPLMVRVGTLYHEGNMTIGDEHRMTSTIRDVLIGLSQTDWHKGGPTAVVGCSAGEVHELGSLMVRAVLTQAGWNVIYLGLNTPDREFADQQDRHAAELVCVSFMAPRGRPEAHRVANALSERYDKERPYSLALGGVTLDDDEFQSASYLFEETRAFTAITPFEDWIRSLN